MSAGIWAWKPSQVLHEYVTVKKDLSKLLADLSTAPRDSQLETIQFVNKWALSLSHQIEDAQASLFELGHDPTTFTGTARVMIRPESRYLVAPLSVRLQVFVEHNALRHLHGQLLGLVGAINNEFADVLKDREVTPERWPVWNVVTDSFEWADA